MKEYIGQRLDLDMGQIGPSPVIVEDVSGNKVTVRHLTTGRVVDMSIGEFKIYADIDIKRRID